MPLIPEPPRRYDDPTAKGPMILSRHFEGQQTALDLGVIWYAGDAARLCAALNALAGASGISYHFRSLYATASSANQETPS